MYNKELDDLFNRYRTNTITEEELNRLFELLSEQEHDEQLKEMLEVVWDKLPQPADLPVRETPVRPLGKALALTGMAAAVLVLAGLGWWMGVHWKTAPLALHTETNATGQPPRRLELPDHTIAWLNAGTTLQYAPGFAGRERLVQLEGEAYFEVADNPVKPFLVKSGAVTTTVLGTRFNVQAYPADRQVAVTVLAGKVTVKSGHPNSTTVGPHQTAIYNTSTLLTTTNEAGDDDIAWTKNMLVFHDTPLSQVARMLETRFNKKVVVARAIQDCVFFGEFSHESLQDILASLATTLNGRVTEKGGIFYISGNGCL